MRETPAYAAASAAQASSPARRTALRLPLPAGWAAAGLGVLGTAAAGAIVGLCSALVLAAAERPSFLSGPAEHGFPRWMVGPLAGRFGALPASPPALEADLVRVLVALGALWLVVWLCAARIPALVLCGAILVSYVVLLLGPPLSLTDIFNYLHYGRMLPEHGLNPYVSLPVAARDDPTYLYSNWHHLPSPYGPLFTLIGEAVAGLSVPAAYWTIKALLLVCSLGTLALVAVAARRLGKPWKPAVALVAFNPLVLVYGIGGAHGEPFMLVLAVAAVCLVLLDRDIEAGACAVLAAGVKPSAALLVLLVVAGSSRRWRALAGAAAAGAVTGLVVLVHYGGHLPATGIQDRFVTPLSVGNVLAALAGQGGMTAFDRTLAHAVLAVVALGATVAVWRRRDRLAGAAGLVMLFSVLTLGWTMPWYAWWILPFAALARTRALTAACIVLTAWLALGAIPQMPRLIHDAGFYPTRSAAGKINHDYTQRYLR
ncbi:glycosyltransferase 87 family protein [Conexibacter woesei]|uniref:glycosyltransferase 87 family protein n=1 Tax=Conexibacter woesei TaxID=191495 RepID=UPI0004075AE1|nr:glycosyltransferase 87 family protein [Conexibacter woesei]